MLNTILNNVTQFLLIFDAGDSFITAGASPVTVTKLPQINHRYNFIVKPHSSAHVDD